MHHSYQESVVIFVFQVYPGASSVKRADGTLVTLKADDPRQRQAVAKQLYSQQAVSKKRKTSLDMTQIVYRHVQVNWTFVSLGADFHSIHGLAEW